jgi:5'-phosphate synthase pdxT subunit
MASDAGNYRNLEILKLMDIEVDRNAFGRQTASFETPLDIPLLGPEPFPGLFIRGPKIKKAGPRVNILSRLEDGTEVAARQDNLLAMAFHPELVEDLRMHRYFVQMAADFELIKA